jgi:hypothetical protein
MKHSKNGGAYGKYEREGKCIQGFDDESHEKIVTGKTYAWLRAICNTEMGLKLYRTKVTFAVTQVKV